MKQHSCIIIEDEPLALERTSNFVERIPFLDLKSTFDNALEGLAFLKTNKVDILFLDINMDELSGIELLESAEIKSEVIFTTAYQEYALKGYELNVTDYLLKPFTFSRFLQAVDKAQSNLKKFESPKSKDYIFIKTENRLEKVILNEILYIEGMRDYRRIHLEDKTIMTLQTFGALEKLIPPELVCRVHKSYMVGIQKIEAIERGRIVIEAERIPISAKYKDSFLKNIE